MADYDLIIRGGSVIDGTGEAARTADVAVVDGVIAEVGAIDGNARREIDADGALVIPGIVDIHSHYDGQATWDHRLQPSSWHGVTTVVTGNCGVGFAPVHDADHDKLIELMEGVEDIPGTALYEGMEWGQWESFPDYMDYIASRRYSLDIGAQVAHGAVRYYVMGVRGSANEDATADDIDTMAALVAEAVDAGAVGFSTSRTIGHRSLHGSPVPGTFAPVDELVAIAEAMGRTGKGVFELIPAGTVGKLEGLGGERFTPYEEFELMRAVAKRGGRR
jgi:N-acyl-D-aspartate/D-glutamate deacylase